MMKRKLLYTAFVAGVMGSAVPAHAAPYQTMYVYYYSDNGQPVGEQKDLCTSSGVVIKGTYVWGYSTSDVDVVEWIGCEDGHWVPLQ